MRLPSKLIALLAVVLIAFNVGVALSRSMIPSSLETAVVEVETRLEKHPGVDDVWLIHTRGETLNVDAEIGRVLREGDRLEKRAWSTRLRQNETSLRLRPSRDFYGMATVLPIVLVLVIWLLSTQNHSSSSRV